MILRRAAAALALAAALPAAAYVLPAPAVVKKAAEKRAALDLLAVEVAGTVELRGPALARLGGLAPAAGGALSVPARILVKVPGRVRIELQPAGAAEAERPFVALRDDRLAGQGGLEATPAAAALARGLAALLAAPTGGEGHAMAEALARRGVRLDDATLGRFNGRLAYVVGGHFVEGKRTPLAFVDKESFMPLRLLAAEGGAVLDVRLLDWASPTGGDWFPRAVEVWDGAQLLVKFTTEKAAANPKLGEALFQP